MSAEQENAPPPQPLFDALVRPPTLWGCDPVVFSTLATIGGLFAYVAIIRLSIVLGVVGALLFYVGVRWSSKKTAEEPYFLAIYLRSLRYRKEYYGHARWDQDARQEPWWRFWR